MKEKATWNPCFLRERESRGFKNNQGEAGRTGSQVEFCEGSGAGDQQIFETL